MTGSAPAEWAPLHWCEDAGVRWLSTELGDAHVAFSTRVGGTSAAPWDTLNLGILTGDDPGHVRANRECLAGALGLEPGRIAIGRQVHEADLAGHTGPQTPAPFATPGQDPPEVDGHHTSERDLALLVFVADCLPIAVVGERGVAMLHCGWRGMAAGIVNAGVEAVGGYAAAIGPGIGPCCYEVGDEVLAAFAPLGDGLVDGRMLDLVAVARTLLDRTGVEQVLAADLCTRCSADLFFSHRGQGPETGRQAGLVWRTA